MRVGHRRRKLALPESLFAQLPDSTSGVSKFSRGLALPITVRVDHGHWNPYFITNESDRQDQIRIVGHDESTIIVMPECIGYEVRCKIDVCSLFLEYLDVDELGLRYTMYLCQQKTTLAATLELPIFDGEARDSFKRSNINLLSQRALRIAGRWLNQGREVSDSLYSEAWGKPLANLMQVKPLIRRTLDGSVVQVEAIDVETSCL